MKKSVCITPVNIYQGDEVLAWMDRQQTRGLFPCRVGSLVSVFQCSIRKTQSFFLLPKNKEGMEQAPLDWVEEHKWKYVCAIGHTFSLCSAPNRTQQPHQDLASQQKCWQQQAKVYLLSVSLIPLLVGVLALCWQGMVFTGWTLALGMIYLGSVCIGLFQYRDSHGFTPKNPRRMCVRNGCILGWSALVMVLGLILIGQMCCFS